MAIGLDKIYLHHSIYPNKTTMIECHGHHNSSGRNGSGKTTLQKLIPIFYGEKVNKVVPTQGTKEPFIKYYLKSEASFIAFEYTSASRTCTVILHKKNEHLYYRFLTGALTDFFFTEQNKPLLQQGKLIYEHIKELKAAGHPISSSVSTADDYRAIIQNDKQLLRTRRAVFPNIISLAQVYSLTGWDNHMQMMHKLTYALQTRSSMFSGLQDMIVSTQFDMQTLDKPKHEDNKTLANDLKSLHDFAKQEKTVRNCIALSDRRMQVEQASLRLGRKLKQVYQQQLQSVEIVENEIDKHQKALAKIQEKAQADRDNLHEQNAQIKGEIKHLEQHLNTVYQEKDEWENQRNIQFKQQQYQQINNLKQQYQTAFEHYQELIAGISEEQQHFEQKKEQNKQTAKEQKHQLEQQIAEEKHQLSQFKQEIELQKQQSRDLQDKQIQQQEAQYRPKREEKIAQLAEVKVQAQTQSNNQQESAAEELAEQNLQSATRKLQIAQQQLEKEQQKQQQLQQQRRQDEEKLSELTQQLATCKAQERQIHKQRFPENKSLLSFLRQQKPDWSHDIGKLINPELLHHTQLTPSLSAQEIDTFYGITLNLDKLDLPECTLNEETLKHQHQNAQDELQRQTDKQQHHKQELLKLQQQLKQQEQEQLKTEQQHKQAQHTQQIAYSKLEQVKQDNKQNRQTRQEQAQQQAKSLKKQLDAHLQDHEKTIATIKQSHQQHLTELQVHLGSKDCEVEANIQSLKSQINTIEDNLKINLNDLDKAFKQACAHKGLDDKIEAAAKQRLETHESAYTQAQNSTEEIQQYQHWLKSQWQQVSKYEAELSHNTQQQAVLDKQIKQQQQQIQEQTDQCKQQLAQLKQQKERIQTQLSQAKDSLNRAGELPKGDDIAEEDDLFTLTELLNSELNDHIKLKADTLKSVQQSLLIMHNRPDGRIYQQWLNLYQPHCQNSAQHEQEEGFLLNLPPVFANFLDNYLPQISKTTQEAIISVIGQIDDYYLRLKSMSGEINSVSHRLSKQIKTNQQVDALSDISIKLRSKVEEIDAWREMQVLHKQWHNYRQSKQQELPPTSLGDSLSHVIAALEYAQPKADIKSMISLVVTLKENGNYKEVTSDKAMNDTSSNGLSLLAVIAIYIGMSRYLCPNKDISLTWPVDELSSIDLENIASLFNMLNQANIRLFSAFPTKEHNILKHFDICHELDFHKGAMSMSNELPQLDEFTAKLRQINTPQQGATEKHD